MEYLFFTIFLGLLLWGVPNISFAKNSCLRATEIRFLLLLKVCTGVACAYYFKNVFTVMDYELHNQEGILEYHLLLKDPILFFSDFKNDLSKYGAGGIFEASDSFWGYLRFHILYKYLAIQNLITRGNFYLNAAVFSAVIFWGHLAFYRIFYSIYQRNKYLLLALCFVLPSVLLYTAVPNKDGLVFLCLGIVCYIFYNYISAGSTSFKNIGIFFIGIFGIFLLRNFILMPLLPAMFTVLLVKKYNRYTLARTLGLYSIFIVLFFVTGSFNNSFDLPQAVVKRKADFALIEKGNTDLPMRILEPTAISFIGNVPQAINHVLLRPYPFEFNLSSTLAGVEIYFYLLLFVLFIATEKNIIRKKIHPFNIFGIAFSISMIIIIGLTIPNAGAITRYRSIIWIFLLCPVVCKLADRYKTMLLENKGKEW